MLSFDHALTQVVPVWRRGLKGKKRLSDTTITQYAQYLRRLDHEVPLSAAGRLADPDTVLPRLRAWRDGLEPRRRAGTLSAAKVRGDRFAMIAFYAALMELGVYPSNPARLVQGDKLVRGKPTPLSLAEVAQLFAAVDLSSPTGLRDRVMLECYFHAMRVGTVCALTSADVSVVELKNRRSTVVLTYDNDDEEATETALKPEVAPLFALYFARTHLPDVAARDPDAAMTVFEQALPRFQDAPVPVFLHRGRPMTKREAERVFAELRTKAGLPAKIKRKPVGPHTLRHTCLTELLHNTGNLRLVQEQAGHKDIRTTTIYTDVPRDARVAGVSTIPTMPLGDVWT